jgi:hypothetical protein
MVTCLAYCLDKELWKAIEYLRERVRVLKEQQEKDKRIACPLLVNPSFLASVAMRATILLPSTSIPLYSYLMASGAGYCCGFGKTTTLRDAG